MQWLGSSTWDDFLINQSQCTEWLKSKFVIDNLMLHISYSGIHDLRFLLVFGLSAIVDGGLGVEDK